MKTLLSLAILAILGVLLSCGDAPPPRPDASGPSATAPAIAPRPPPAVDATPSEQLSRRIADLEGQLTQARADFRAAQARERDAELAVWRSWSRWICGLGLPLAAAAAALGVWFGLAKVAIPIAGAVAIACLTLLGFAESLAWLTWLAPALGLAALVAVAWILIRRRDTALAATVRLGEALKSSAAPLYAMNEAKRAQVQAGVHRLVQKARGK